MAGFDSSDDFRWRDGERVILFADGLAGRLSRALADEGWDRFDLVATERGQSAVDPLVASAGRRLDVPEGPVPDAARAILDAGPGAALVAVGGGRTIDAAKAVASVTGARVCAVPTTLSGAEVTGGHRPPAGHDDPGWRPVRAALVACDPDLMTSAPEPLLRASAMNALAHGIEAPTTLGRNPVATAAAGAGAAMIAGTLDAAAHRPRELALGAILSAYAMDSTGYGLHHVLAQSVVRTSGAPHAEVNAALLPHTVEALGRLAPGPIAGISGALGVVPSGLPARLAKLSRRSGGLAGLGVGEEVVDRAAEMAAARPELANTPGAPDAVGLRAILETALAGM